jgi:hypothetical protein
MSSLAGAKSRADVEEDAAKASRSRKNETVKKMRLAFPVRPPAPGTESAGREARLLPRLRAESAGREARLLPRLRAESAVAYRERGCVPIAQKRGCVPSARNIDQLTELRGGEQTVGTERERCSLEERCPESLFLVRQDVPRFSKEMIVNFNGQFIPHTLVFWGSEEPGSADDETDPKKALGWHTGLLVKSLVLVVTNAAGGKTTMTPLGLVSFDDGEIELLDADKLHYKLDSYEMDQCRLRVLASACQLNTALANVTQPNPETQMRVLGSWRLEAKISTHSPPQTQADNISMIDWMEIAEDEIVEAYKKLGLIGTHPNALPLTLL